MNDLFHFDKRAKMYDIIKYLILKSIEAGKQAGVAQPEAEKKIFTNFIR